jgi:DNA-binding MarR family transcriptional regulator
MIKASDQPVTVTRLCEPLQLGQSGVTQLVQRAEDLGLIARRALRGDARSHELRLTPKGEQLLERAFLELGPERERLATAPVGTRRYEALIAARRALCRRGSGVRAVRETELVEGGGDRSRLVVVELDKLAVPTSERCERLRQFERARHRSRPRPLPEFVGECGRRFTSDRDSSSRVNQHHGHAPAFDRHRTTAARGWLLVRTSIYITV